MSETVGNSLTPLDKALQAGRAALAQGLWAEAERRFADAADIEPESAEVNGLLAESGWWQHREKPTFDARERAYHLYRKQGDRNGASRMAMWLGADSLEFRGQPAVAQGWFQRAGRLLEGLDPSPDHAWFDVWMGRRGESGGGRRLPSAFG